MATLLALCAAAATVLSGAAAQAPAGTTRSLQVTLAPAPGDVAVLAIRFPHAGRRALSAQDLKLNVIGPFGADFLAVAVPRRAAGAPPKEPVAEPALVVLANRPTALLDPAAVRLRVRSAAALGAASLRRRTDPLARPEAASAGLCTLTAHGAALTAGALHVLGSRGAPLAGFAAATAVADAYDAACGLPYPIAFRRAVAGPGASCAPGSTCVPAPGPSPTSEPVPTPEPPRCQPCNQKPGYACPLGAAAAVCVARREEPAPAAPAGGH